MKLVAILTTALFLVSASSTVSAFSIGLDYGTAASTSDDIEPDTANPPSPSTALDRNGSSINDGLQCLGLPRNTLLASCPAPCLQDAPCILYDQDANHSQLTGCDYDMGIGYSFCASNPMDTCEFHCFPPPARSDTFDVKINFKTLPPAEPRPRTAENASLLEMPDVTQLTADFVSSVGPLSLSNNVLDVRIIGQDDEAGDRFVDVDVDPALLANAPSVMSLTLSGLPLDTDRVQAIVASAPPTLTQLFLFSMRFETVSWEVFASVPDLEVLSLSTNGIASISASDYVMPALIALYIASNELTGFSFQAPNLEQLHATGNKLVRIPDSVFTCTKLQTLNLLWNPVIRPLVLTQSQVEFLEALPDLYIELVDPPDQGMVSALSASEVAVSYGNNYTDNEDISLLLAGAKETLLRGDPLLPVRVVDSEKAAKYNDLLELRATFRVEPSSDPSVSREGSCLDLPRNSLLASCPAPCLQDSPCIVYDQDIDHTKLTGCDYGPNTDSSFCTSNPMETCEVQCFAKVESMFGFSIGQNELDLGEPRPGAAEDLTLLATPSRNPPIQYNNFVSSIGMLNLSQNVKAVQISGVHTVENAQVVDVDVNPALLSNSPSVTSLTLFNIPVDTDRAKAIVASAPQLKQLDLHLVGLHTLSWEMFAPVPNLKVLSLDENQISFIPPSDFIMPALSELSLASNQLTGFSLQAPELEQLVLEANLLVRIPESVFTYPKLKLLVLSSNLLFRPLVLTAQQVEFLEALASLSIGLVDPPDAEIVSRLPIDGGATYGNYSDSIDLRSLLVGATETLLRNEITLPVLVVDSDKAAQYNELLETRARARGIPRNITNTFAIPFNLTVPVDTCQGVPRNTLLSYCAENCPTDGACVAYDPPSVTSLSGCDYNVASTPSVCTSVKAKATTCEFQCFPAFEPQSQFKFLIPFKTELGPKITRLPENDNLSGLKTTETPFLSNSFVGSIGVLNLTSTVTEVSIAGGRSESGTPGVVIDVVVSEKLLAKAPAVTSLSLMNMNLGSSDLAAIIGSALPVLKSLNLRNTNLAAVPEAVFANLMHVETLVLAQNSLTILDIKTTALTQLTTLDLSDNALATLEIKAPNLKTLDLSWNNLVRIPLSVFSLTNLETLNLQGNLLAIPLVLSSSQLAVLNAIPNLQLQAAAEMEVMHLMPTPTTTSTIQLANGTVVAGIVTTVGGVPAIIVDELIANQYNKELEEKQQESMPRPRTRSSSGGGSTSATPSNSLNSTGLSAGSTSPQGNSSTGGTQGSSSGERLPSSVASGSASGSKLNPSGDEVTAPAIKGDANEPSNASTVTMLMLGGVGSALAVAVLVFIIIVRRRRANTDKESSYVTMTDNEDGSSVLDTQSSAREVVSWWKDDVLLSHRLNAGDISDVRVIGTDGGSAIKWLIDFRGGSRQLVSKRVIHTDERGSVHDAKLIALVAEAKIATSLRYPSIVPFVGVAWTDKTDLQVLYEYMPNGDLGSYLARTDASSLSWLPTKLQLAIDIIEALVYTHSFNPPLLHRDLKCSNVLLDDTFKAKLGNLGSARTESDSSTMTAGEIGSGRWLAPEILLGSTSYGTPSDMYSFGVVLCELDTHKAPYEDELQVEGGGMLSEAGLLEGVARGELRPSLSVSCPAEIRRIAEACLACDPEERPTAMQVAHSLRSMRSLVKKV